MGRSEPEAPEENYFVEAHYYDGGLRHRMFAQDATRPVWAPDAQDVGFRDEFGLKEGDRVVEFARFATAGRRITWIGVYRRSIDHVHGDRSNHAGIGVWLRDLVVADPHLLLAGLRKLAETVEADRLDGLEKATRIFLSTEYLPKYLLPRAHFAEEMSGLPFGVGLASETQRYLAVSPGQADDWSVASDTLFRATFVPSYGEANRILALVPAPGTAAEHAVVPMPASRDRLLADFAKSVASGFARAATEIASLVKQLEEATAARSTAQASLDRMTAERDELAKKIAELERIVSADDARSALAQIFGKLSAMETVIGTKLEAIDTVRTGLFIKEPPANDLPMADVQSKTAEVRRENSLVYDRPAGHAIRRGIPIESGGEHQHGWWAARGQTVLLMSAAIIGSVAIIVIFTMIGRHFGWW